MGMMIEGVWHDRGYDTSRTGRFRRRESSFRSWVTADGSAGPSGEGGFPAEPGRYHLYVSLACPWAHRTLILRSLKGLEEAISLSIVDPLMGSEGWVFGDGPGCVPDTVNGAQRLQDIYRMADPVYTGLVTVPVLWDRRRRTIVNNESAEIILMLNEAFDGVGAREGDYYPQPLRPAIDEVNHQVYENVNNGVYKAGFAGSQEAYDEAVTALFLTLDRLERRLGKSRYLVGDTLTLADWRLFTTLLRFDPVYVGHFKCNLRRIADYSHLSGHLRELYQMPGIAETCDLEHIKGHYYRSHRTINPSGIVPAGPVLDLWAPHGRG
jgi:glutathionyl-hydroquinone reductase